MTAIALRGHLIGMGVPTRDVNLHDLQILAPAENVLLLTMQQNGAAMAGQGGDLGARR